MWLFIRDIYQGLTLTTFAFFKSAKALKIMQSASVLFPSTTIETFIPGMKGHVGSTLNVPVAVINVMRIKNKVVKGKCTTPRSP